MRVQRRRRVLGEEARRAQWAACASRVRTARVWPPVAAAVEVGDRSRARAPRAERLSGTALARRCRPEACQQQRRRARVPAAGAHATPEGCREAAAPHRPSRAILRLRLNPRERLRAQTKESLAKSPRKHSDLLIFCNL